MGPKTTWAAKYSGDIPNSDDFFLIEVTFTEYPKSYFQLVEAYEDEAVSFAHFDTEDCLRSYIESNL
jgi:hypothetical protein